MSTPTTALAVTTDGTEIVAGEYIVSGTTADDLDYGRVWLDDDGRVMASWGTGNGHSPIASRVGETVPGVHGVYTTEAAARGAYEEHFAELSRPPRECTIYGCGRHVGDCPHAG